MNSNLSIKETRGVTSSSKAENEENVNKDIKSFNFLKKKTNRIKSKMGLPHNLRCDICLEWEKYSQQNLLQCSVCRAKCHLNCYKLENQKEDMDISSHEKGNFKCSRCQHSLKKNKDYRNFQ